MSSINESYAINSQSVYSDSVKINTLKGLAIIGLIIVGIDHVFSLFFNNHFYNNLSSLIGYSVFGGVLYFLKEEKYALAKDFFCYGGVILAAIHHYLYGVEVGVEMLYLLIIVLSAYLYSLKKSTAIFATSLLLYFGIQLFLIQSGSNVGILYSSIQMKIAVFLFSAGAIAYFFSETFEEEDNFNALKHKQNESLMASNEQLRRFNYVVVNDLKTPISNIVNYSSVLASDKDLTPEVEQEHTESIIQGGKQLSEMVQSIKNFQELEEADFVYEKVHIVDAIEESCKTLRQLMDSNRMTISYEANKDIVTSRYQLFITFKSLVEHIIAYKQDICMNVHFSFDDSDKDYMRIYMDTVTFGPQFKILPRVANKHYVPFDQEVSADVHTDMIVIQKMVNQLGGNVYRTDVEAEKAYLIELPKNKKESNVK